LKYIKSPTLKWHDLRKIKNEGMLEQIVTASMERIRTRGRPWKRWTDEDLKKMGTRYRHIVV
jgi:hypothetical protein